MKTHLVTHESCGEKLTTKLQAIQGDVEPGTLQIVGDEGRLDGFVPPSGIACEPHDLGNVTFVRCDDTPEHKETLTRFLTPDWSHGECKTAALATVEE